MSKYPSEIFGHPFSSQNANADQDRRNHWCPFVNRICYKQSRLISYPFGVCSVHIADHDIAVCPRRFLDGNRVFRDVAQHHFKTTDNILVFSEVHLKSTGTFDFVMVKHKPLSIEIEDFVVIEFQTGQTTQTGKLVKGLIDFMNGQSISYRNYNFGLNAYDIWKRTFTQVLSKGIIMESWGRKIYWIVQEPVYQYFETRYNLKDFGFEEKQHTVFFLYDLLLNAERFELVLSRRTSASIDELFEAFRYHPDIPALEDFEKALQVKMIEQSQLSLHLGQGSKTQILDVKPPTTSGRVRDIDNDEE